MVQQTINLDFIPSGICPVVHATQNDHKLRGIIINPINTSLTGLTASISGTKKDRTGFLYSCDISNGQILVDVTRQMTLFAGDVLCTITLGNSDGDTVSASFVLSVQQCGLEDDIDVSESDLALLAEMPSMVAEAKDAAQRAEQAAGLSADGTTIVQASDGKLSVSNTVLSRTLQGMSVDGITSYPTAVGVYRVTATKPSGLPTYASSYGTLIIYGNGYWSHIYIGSGNDVWMTRTTTISTAPSETSWQQVSSNLMTSRTETDLNQITQAGTWRLSTTPTANFPVVLGSSGDQFANALLDVTGLGADMITQRITVTNNSGYPTHAGRTYQRVKRNSTGTWSNWSEVLQSSTFSPVGLASVSEDFNTLTDAGFYPRIFSYLSPNGPNLNCYLFVIASPKTAQGENTYVTQIAISVGTNAFALRTYSSGAWNDWRWTMASFRTSTLANSDIYTYTPSHITALSGDVYVTGKVVEVGFSFTITSNTTTAIHLTTDVLPTCHGSTSSSVRPRCVCRERTSEPNAPTLVAEVSGSHIDIIPNGTAGTYCGTLIYMMG